MHQELVNIALLVKDYDEAIQFYCDRLDFDLIEDTELSDSKRWVRVRPKGSQGCCLLLAKAKDEYQSRFVGEQSGGRVFLFIHTDDFERDYQRLQRHNIEIVRPPSQEVYGTVCVFKDLYGNLWDLIEPVNT